MLGSLSSSATAGEDEAPSHNRCIVSLDARVRRSLTSALLALVTLPFAGVEAQDEESMNSYPARCGAGVTAAERSAFQPLPRGDVFCPLIADPKSVRSFVSYQRGDAADFAADIAAVGIGDTFGFFRVGGGRTGNGVQVGVAGALFAQFDLSGSSSNSSYELLNADYLISLPLTFRFGGFSGRARVYHQSSHLGDEFLLRPNPPLRENLSFESAELLLSADVGALRVYAGGEHFFRREPITLADGLVHGGAELRPRAMARLGNVVSARFVAAADVKTVRDSSWRTGVNARAGFEFGRPREGLLGGRRWSILAEFYDGPSPYGQFHRSQVRLVGVGLHFTH